jgi:prephenate dehydrogenase
MRWMKRLLGDGVSYAGLHPLFGPDSGARGAEGHTVAVCRGRLSASCARRLTGALRGMGMKTVDTTPAIHDRTMASTLFLTQIIGVAARGAAGNDHPFVTPAFNHLRVVIGRAAGNRGDFTGELFRWNTFVPAVLRQFEAALAREKGKILN